MSSWKNFGRAYIVLSLISATFFAVKFYPVLMGKKSPELTATLNNPLQIEGILEHAPMKPATASIGLGVLYQQKGQFGDAERMYRKALTREPEHPDALFRLGALYQSQSKWLEAADLFERSLKKKPEFSQTHNNLALVYDELRRHEEALKHYEEAVRLEPENEIFISNLKLAQRQFDSQETGGLLLDESSLGQTQIQAVSSSDMTIDVDAPIEDQPYFFRSPKRLVLKNGRSITGDVVDKDDEGLWLETGRGMKLHFNRDEIERIEDARTLTAG